MSILSKIFNNTKASCSTPTWDNITLEKFYKIQDILEVQDDYTNFNLIDTIYGVDSVNMDITELSKYPISFLNEPINEKNVKLKDKYEINGRVYVSNVNLTQVKTNQFIDFNNYVTNNIREFEKMLSVFMIPEGHTYNDGYNIKEVQEDLLQLDIVTVQSLCFFFTTQFQLFVQISQIYLAEELKQVMKENPQMGILMKEIQGLDFSLY